MSKTVAIIGAGKAGLVSAKYALENGLKPTVFEKTNQVGGLWSRDSPTAIWHGLFTNVSKYTMMFHDHPWPDKSPIFNTAENVHEYLKSYADKFKLKENINFETKVDSVKMLCNNKWELTSIKNSNKTNETFDHLIVASGLHSKPRIPMIENSFEFKGLQLHSSKFKLSDPRLKDKKVLVVGCSLSGSEIAASLVGHAKTVINIFPRTYLITPRLVKFRLSSDSTRGDLYKIMPNDLFFNRRSFNYPDRNLSIKEAKRLKIEYLSRLFSYQTNKEKSHPDLFVDMTKPDQEILVAISDYYLEYVQSGKIKPIRSRIQKFDKNSIVLENGYQINECDAIIYCTGYDLANEFLEPSILNTLKYDSKDHKYSLILYRCTFHPDLQNFAMIGQTDGTFYTGDELQASWANMIFAGKRMLPKREIMLNEIENEEKKRKKNRKSQYPYGNFVSLCDKFAKDSGQLPNFEEIKKKDLHLYDMLWNSAVNSNHYFLNEINSIKIINEIFDLINRDYVFETGDESIVLDDIIDKFSKFYKLPKGLFNKKYF